MKQEKDSRRSFLKHILAASVAATSVAGTIKPAKSREKNLVSGPGEVLYHESDDFKKYYQSLK